MTSHFIVIHTDSAYIVTWFHKIVLKELSIDIVSIVIITLNVKCMLTTILL